MAILSRKKVLLAICIVGAVLLAADEQKSDEAPRPVNDEIQELTPAETTVDDDARTEPAEATEKSNQVNELKPLKLKERIRAHANIDLPQDI